MNSYYCYIKQIYKKSKIIGSFMFEYNLRSWATPSIHILNGISINAITIYFLCFLIYIQKEK